VGRFEKMIREKDDSDTIRIRERSSVKKERSSAKQESSLSGRKERSSVSAKKPQRDTEKDNDYEMRSSLAEINGVGRIRRNKDRNFSQSINSSMDEDKSKSHMKAADLSQYASTILKPKNSQMNLDDLKQDVSNFEDRLKIKTTSSKKVLEKSNTLNSGNKKTFLLSPMSKATGKENMNSSFGANSGRKRMTSVSSKKKLSVDLNKTTNMKKSEKDSNLPSGASSMRKKKSNTQSKESLASSNTSPKSLIKFAKMENPISARKSVQSSQRSGIKIPIYSKLKKN